MGRGGKLLVFPAYAGMFRRGSRRQHHRPSFPRVCGDVPLLTNAELKGPKFSPRMRGCSVGGAPLSDAEKVFPAYAGMFPLHAW